MSAVCVVQARTGSSRLPGKVVADLAGEPLLGFMLRRLEPMDVDVVVATTDQSRDDPVADVAASRGIPVVRGSEQDVLARFLLALERHPADDVVRLTADCPLVDPDLVARCVETHRAAGAAYTSNTLVRTYPDGLDVEVVAADALRTAAADAGAVAEREHVTPFVYRHPERFPLAAMVGDQLLSHERWTVDTAEDLERVRSIVGALGTRDFSWRDVLAVAPPQPWPFAIRPAGTDPASRVWSVDGAGACVRVSAHAGVGTVSFEGEPVDRDVLVRVVRDLVVLLSADYQTTRLDVPSATAIADAAVWEDAGFTVDGATGIATRERA